MHVKHPVLLAIAALLTVGVSTGIANATYRQRVLALAATTDRVAISSSNTNLSNQGMTNVTIVSMPVPAGSWVITAKGDFVNFGPSDYARCALFADNGQISGGITSTVGDPNLPGGQGPAAYVQAFADIGAVTSSTGFTASLQCSHDHSTPDGYFPPYVDAGATVWAHRVRG